MNQQNILFRISQLLSRLTEQVEILNNNGEFSINVHAENILIDILNTIYDCNLENVNYKENKIYPAIDLRDYKNRIAIQVTSTANMGKVKHTLSEYISNKLYEKFDKLHIFILTKKQTKYDQTTIDNLVNGIFSFTTDSIIDKTDLYKELNAQNNFEKIKKVCELLEQQFADSKNELDKWNIYCKGLYEYDQYISNLYKYLEIKGFSPRVNNNIVKLDIDNIYIPLKFKFDFSYNRDNGTTNFKEPSYDIITAIQKFNKMVVLGDPGSGKSTTLKYLAYKICTDRHKQDVLSSLIPIYIKASEFAEYLSKTHRSLSEFIIDNHTKYGLLFSESLENNSLIILFDGLDEVNITNSRHNVVDRLNSFVAQYPSIKIIVSSRLVGYSETRLNGSFFHFEVDKFNREQIKKFITNWYLSVSLYSDGDTTKALTEASILYNSIYKNKSVYRLASNPLLITIITLINYQGNNLPEKRVALYDIATSTFLDNWVKLRPIPQNHSFERDSLIEILAPISFYIHENYSSGLIPEKELKHQLEIEYSNAFELISKKEVKKDISNIVSFLREDAGFLFEKGLDKNGEALFGFVHLTFQEYFAAIEFKTRWEEGGFKNNFSNYIFNANWSEVVKLTASLFKMNDPSRQGRKKATQFINDIIDLEEIIPEMNKRLITICEILKDDVEIESKTFNKIVEIIFNDILAIEGTDYFNQTTFIGVNCLTSLLNSNYYQEPIMERMIESIELDSSCTLSKKLMQALMSASDISLVQNKMIDLLKSERLDIKILMFEYSTVSPIAGITLTETFKTEIVKYINSFEFEQTYSGYLPTQYTCSFEKDMESILESIELVNNSVMKGNLIDFYVFSWGLGDVNNIKVYYQRIHEKYPEINLNKIEKHIKELDKYKSIGLPKYPIISFNNISIYKRERDESLYIFTFEDIFEEVMFPFSEERLRRFFGSNTSIFLDFMSILNSAISSETKEITVSNINDLYSVIYFDEYLHWSMHLNYNSIIRYALSKLFDGDQVDDRILEWLRKKINRLFLPLKFNSTFKQQDLEEKIISSQLKIFDKLLLLRFINPDINNQELISIAINEYNQEEAGIEKDNHRRLLSKLI